MGESGGGGFAKFCAKFVGFILMLFVVITGIGLEVLVDGLQVFCLRFGEVDFFEDSAVNAEVGSWAVVASATCFGESDGDAGRGGSAIYFRAGQGVIVCRCGRCGGGLGVRWFG